MKGKFLQQLVGGLALLASFAANGGAIIQAPLGPVTVGSQFDVTVGYDFEGPLGSREYIRYFGFEIGPLTGISFVSATPDPAFSDRSGPSAGLFATAIDPRLQPGPDDTIALTTLTFLADSVGPASGSILDDAGVYIESGDPADFGDADTFLEISGDFNVRVVEKVPAPGTLALLALGLVGVGRRLRIQI